MRGLISFLFLCIPICAGTFDITAICDGIVYPGADSCTDGSPTAGGVWAEVIGGDTVIAGAGYPGGNASASFVGNYLFTATGGSGDGFAEPYLWVRGDSGGGGAVGGASASLGGCQLSVAGYGVVQGCPWNSVPFEFGVPQILTLSLSAGASSSYGPVSGSALAGGPEMFVGFFDSNGQAIGASYTFVPVVLSPEPGTLLLTMLTCGALIVFGSARKTFRRVTAPR
jgi:hypothetical protein